MLSATRRLRWIGRVRFRTPSGNLPKGPWQARRLTRSTPAPGAVIRSTRVASRSASAAEWVTKSVAGRVSAISRSVSASISSTSGASSETKGSSSSRSSGRVTKARASASRRCCPSDSCRGKSPPLPASPTAASAAPPAASAAPVTSVRFSSDAAPGQQRRLLEHHRDALRPPDLALEVAVEPGDDAQQRRLADARGPEHRQRLARRDREAEVAQHLVGAEGLAPDLHLERAQAVLQARARVSNGCSSSASIASITATKASA